MRSDGADEEQHFKVEEGYEGGICDHISILSISPSLCSFLFFYPAFHTDRYGLIHQARISASVNAMRILNTGTEVEAAVADALVSFQQLWVTWDCSFFGGHIVYFI